MARNDLWNCCTGHRGDVTSGEAILYVDGQAPVHAAPGDSPQGRLAPIYNTSNAADTWTIET